MKETTTFTWAGMRKIALGRLYYNPVRFGLMLVGDFLDALTGYIEGESDRIKNNAELIRTSTAILWNIQVGKENKLTPEELWPFPWDKATDGGKEEVLSEEEVKRREAEMEKILNNIMPG